MSMNREQKRAAQRAGQVGEDGSPSTATRERRAPAPRHKSDRTGPVEFGREVRAELRKVAWPTRDEVVRYSTIVLIALLVFTVFVFVIDFLFGELFRVLLDPGNATALGSAAASVVGSF